MDKYQGANEVLSWQTISQIEDLRLQAVLDRMDEAHGKGLSRDQWYEFVYGEKAD